MIRASGLLLALLWLASAAPAADTYVQTVVDSNGQLHILMKHRREIVPKKEPGQVSFQKPEIAPDGHAVGWLAMFPGTSYPVPMKLVIYANGETRTFTGSGLPIWRWRFWSEGKEVAFEQETAQGGQGVHYELRNLATGDLVAQYDAESDAQEVAKPPRWVAEIDSDQ